MKTTVGKAPTVNEGVRYYPLGEDQIAHVLESNKVVCLNVSAQVLLDLCNGERSATEICTIVADQLGLEPQAIHQDVASALGCLAVERLVRLESSIFDDLRVFYGSEITRTLVRCGGQTLRVQTTSSAILGQLTERFRSLLSSADEPDPLNLDIIPIIGSADEFAYIHTGNRDIDFSAFSTKGDFDLLKPAIVNPFKWTMTDCVWFHAGAVAKSGDSVIVTGSPASGKSSITAEMCRRGWDYLTDEILPLSDQLRTLPYPVTPLPRKQTREVLPEHRLSELERRYIDLPDDHISKTATTPVAVFLPTYTPASRPRVERVPLGLSAAEILNNCISLTLRGKQAVETVTRLVNRVPTYRLFYTDIDQACDQIEGLIRDTGGQQAAS